MTTAVTTMRDLSPAEMEDLLGRQKIARLGLYDQRRARAYVVPVSYVYHGGAAYLHSAPGLKLELLHEEPTNICFEVEEVGDEGEWQTAIAWGDFEEIADELERQRILRSFGSRLLRGPLRDHQHVGRVGMLGAGETVYRVVFREMTGRADSSGWVATESD